MPSECVLNNLQRDLADSILRLASLDELRILLACGARVNDQVTQGLRPLHYAVWQRYIEAIQFLLVRGGDVNVVDDCGYSALHLSAEHGYLDVMEMLLEHNAKVDFRDDDKIIDAPYPQSEICDDPLRLSIRNNHYEAARFLLEHGANPNARYFFGSEINQISPLNLKFLELLLAFGAHPDSRDRSGLTPLMRASRLPQGLDSVLLLLKYDADFNAMADERHDYRTVMHYAVLSGNPNIVKLLLKQGAKVNFGSEYQKPTPLDLAILKGDTILIKILLDAGANVNASSPIIGTPLHVACSEGVPDRLAIMKMLLQAGADPNYPAPSEDGTPLPPPMAEYLSSGGTELEVLCLLLRYGARVILKTQFRDPLGILHALPAVCHSSEQALYYLLEAAEAYDLTVLRRCTTLPEKYKTLLLQLASEPLSLKHQCRLLLRRILYSTLPYCIDGLPIPHTLKQYLLYETM